jgi:Ca2+-binding RTX toxin-like protein
MKKGAAATGLTSSLSKGGTLTVRGTGNADAIIVTHQSDGRIYLATTRKGGQTRLLYGYKAKNVKAVWIDAGGGNDYVYCQEVYGRICFINGQAGNDTLVGSDYTDDITGGSGNDTIRAYDGNDLVDAGDGDDYVDGWVGDDHITAGRGRDHILGGIGDDQIFAKDGTADDWLNGGPGEDHVSADRDPDVPTDYDEWERFGRPSFVQIEHIS